MGSSTAFALTIRPSRARNRGKFPAPHPWIKRCSAMPYLLDTNTCIAAMRHVPLVVQRMSAVSPADCAISTITGYELYTGIDKCADPTKDLAKVNMLLATVRQLAFDDQSAP